MLYYQGETHYTFPVGTGKQPVVVLASEADVIGYTPDGYALRSTQINMPSLDKDYVMLSGVQDRVQNDCTNRLAELMHLYGYRNLSAPGIVSIEEVSRIDPEPGMIGVGFLVRYQFTLPKPYDEHPPEGCEPVGDGTFEAPPLYGMTLYAVMGEGYVLTRRSAVPSDELPGGSPDDVYRSLLTRLYEEEGEKIHEEAKIFQEKRLMEQYPGLAWALDTDFADGCEPDTRRRLILRNHLNNRAMSISNTQADRFGKVDFSAHRAEVSEFTLVGFRDKVTVRDGPDYLWYEVALYRLDYRLPLDNPEFAFDMPVINLKVDGDAMVPENGPVFFAVISGIDEYGNYTAQVAFQEYESNPLGRLHDLSSSRNMVFMNSNIDYAIRDLIRDYQKANP